jgi:proteasome accessory factor A
MIVRSTALKVGLVKLALHLCEAEQAPLWRFADPVRAIQSISRDEGFCFNIELAGRSRTNAYEVFESYFSAAEATLELDEEMRWTIDTGRRLLAGIRSGDLDAVRREVDWAAKRHVLEQAMAESGTSWRDPALRAYDLEYHNIDPDDGLHAALVEMEEVVPNPPELDLLTALEGVDEPTRAYARGLAVRKYEGSLVGVCWRSLTLRGSGGPVEVELRPDAAYPPELNLAPDVDSFIESLQGIRDA